MTVLSLIKRVLASIMENLGEFVVNHWILWVLFIGILAFLIASVVSGGMNSATPLTTAQAVQIVNQQKGIFIDVRDKKAFEKEHIADAINIPIATLSTDTSAIKDKKKPVILVPALGQNIHTAVKQLQQDGVTDVYLLKGGINAWKDAKLPVFN